jgi:hypothetical protein
MRPRAIADVDAYIAMDRDIEVRSFITPDFRDNFDVARYEHSLRERIAGGQDYEVRYEAKKTKRSAPAVKKAVKRVGNSRKRVEKRLGR